MEFSLNRAALAGVLVTEPQRIGTEDNPRTAARFLLRTTETWTDRNSGERRTRSDTHAVCVHNEYLAKLALDHCHVGTRIYVEGAFQNRRITRTPDESDDSPYTICSEVVLTARRSSLVMIDGAAPNVRLTSPAVNDVSSETLHAVQRHFSAVEALSGGAD